MTESVSKMEAITLGQEELDPNDWCYDAQCRMKEGSDGLWVRFGPPLGPSCASQLFAFNFNPCVSCGAIVLLFGLVGFCAVPPGTYCSQATVLSSGVQVFQDVECFMPQKEFDDWMKWVTLCFTWLYIITQDVWIVFAVYLWASKYGKIKLGRDTDEPEFTYFAWFSMLFTCGVATGLFYFAVSEPIYYYLIGASMATPTGYYERNRWTYSGVYIDDQGDAQKVWATPNDRAQNAMTTTWYHWGLHGWVCYCLLGVLLAFLHFRKGLPMTIKTCFYPLIGTRIYGFLGDFLDTISVVATTMGVCTSLGLGVMQLNSGLELLNGDQMWLGEPYYNSYNSAAWSDRTDDLKQIWDQWAAGNKGSWPGDAGKVAKLITQTNQQMLLIWIITAGATGSVMLGLKNGIKQLALLCLGLGQFVIFYVWMMDDTWFLSNFFIQTIGHYIGTLPILGFYASAIEQSEVNNPYGEYASWQFWWTIFYWGWWIACLGTICWRVLGSCW
jgi:choline-glycine betaine transporter